MWKNRRVLQMLLAVAVLALFGWSTHAALKGEVGYNLHYLSEPKTFGNSQLKYKLALYDDVGFDAAYHLSFVGAANHRPVVGTSWDLDEAYADVYLADMDIRIGRQAISWGTADGINPTSDINPKDFGALSSLELKGKPVPAVTAAYYLPGGASLTGVWVLDFVPGDVPVQAGLPPATDGPVGDGDQFAYALRAEFPVQGWPVYATYYRGWDDLPAGWLTFADPAAPPPQPRAQYRRMHSLGLATDFEYQGASVWLEGAYKTPDELDALADPFNLALSSNDSYLQMVVGADYSFDNGFYASGQVVYNQGGSLLSPYFNPLTGREAQTYLMLRGQYAPQDKHDLELMALYNTTDSGVMILPQYTYDLAESTKLTLGAVVAAGSDTSEFADLKNAAQGITVGLKMSF